MSTASAAWAAVTLRRTAMTHRTATTLASTAAALRALKTCVAAWIFHTRAARFAIEPRIVLLLFRGILRGRFTGRVNCFGVAGFEIYIRVVSFIVRQVGCFVVRFVTGVVVAVVMHVAVCVGFVQFGFGMCGIGFGI